MATPVETIARKRFRDDAERLFKLAGERHAVGFVLGLPINMDGTEGPRAQATRAFARNLAKLTELPIALWDERLSTAAVERALIEADVSREQAQGGDRSARRRLHSAGRAGSAGALIPLPLVGRIHCFRQRALQQSLGGLRVDVVGAVERGVLAARAACARMLR